MHPHVIRVPALPGGASMLVDGTPADLTLWARDDLSDQEVAQLVAQAVAFVASSQERETVAG